MLLEESFDGTQPIIVDKVHKYNFQFTNYYDKHIFEEIKIHLLIWQQNFMLNSS